jgi:hypothetical protein
VFFSRSPAVYATAVGEVFCWYKWPLLAVYCEQICHHLSSYGKRRTIGISLLFFLLIDQVEFMVLFGRELGSFHQHTLDMLIALFGKRRS